MELRMEWVFFYVRKIQVSIKISDDILIKVLRIKTVCEDFYPNEILAYLGTE